MIATIETPGLRFHEETHTYWLDGVELPSVTTVIRDNRLSDDFAMVNPHVLEARRALGQAVHVATHYADEGTLDLGTVDPLVIPYLDAWNVFRAERGVDVVELEQRYAHPIYRFAGTIDRQVRVDGTRVPIVLDIKIGDPTAAAAHIQTAAYAELFRTAHPEYSVIARWSVRLQPDRHVPYTVTEYRSATDWRRFRSALDMTYARFERGLSWRLAA